MLARKTIVTVTLLFLASASAQSICVNTERGPVGTVNCISLTKGSGFPSQFDNAFTAGFMALNNCNNDVAFPMFSETGCDNASSFRNINVVYNTGFGVGTQGGKCGDFQGTKITLFKKARRDNGEIFNCDATATIRDTLTHELGHAMGLDDNNCGGNSNKTSMMAPVSFAGSVYRPRSPHSDEKTKLDEINNTAFEEFEEECGQQPEDCADCPVSVCSPVVFDLADTGFEFTSLRGGVNFDIDADGALERTAWTERGSTHVFLAMDRNGNGQIDSASELFGDSTQLLSGGRAEHGYHALAELEVELGDGDGVIEPSDEVYEKLVIWLDRNHNGKSEWGELLPLQAANIVGIACHAFPSFVRDEYGNSLKWWSSVYVEQDGETRALSSVDVFFQIHDRNTIGNRR